MECIFVYKKTSWIIACTNQMTDEHHSAKKKKKSGVKLIAMASVFHRAGGGTWRVELWGMGEGGEGIR